MRSCSIGSCSGTVTLPPSSVKIDWLTEAMTVVYFWRDGSCFLAGEDLLKSGSSCFSSSSFSTFFGASVAGG